MDDIKVCLLLIWTGAITRTVGAADVTTVYKLNSVHSNNPPQYLDTCSASVYLENNDHGLPLFEKKSGNSFYRLIPPLYNSSNDSQWLVISKNVTVNFTGYQEKKQIFGGIEDVFQNDILNKKNMFVGVTFKKDIALRKYPYGGIRMGVGYHAIGYISTKMHSIEAKFSKVLTICDNYNNYCSYNISYGHDQYNNSHVLISIDSQYVTVLDMITSKVYFTKVKVNKQYYGEPKLVRHSIELHKDDDPPTIYEICQINYVIEKRNIYVSPSFDLMKHTSLIIQAFAPRNFKNRLCKVSMIKADIEELATPTDLNAPWEVGNSHLLECKEINQSFESNNIKHIDKGHNMDARWGRFLVKINVTSPDNWNGIKQVRINSHPPIFIENIWEGRDELKIEISNKNKCWNSDKNVIYSIPVVESHSQYSSCQNGGHLHASYCACPPGFIGNQCEIPCGKNKFGSNCSISCSTSSSDCQGMASCTPKYGCSCFPGYHGGQCTQKCKQGYYGVNCKQCCKKKCKSGCDIYSGKCRVDSRKEYLSEPKSEDLDTFLESSDERDAVQCQGSDCDYTAEGGEV